MCDPSTLIPHPDNWRIHGDTQRAAINDILTDIGWAGCTLVNVNSNHILNGHLRQEEAIKVGSEIPVLWIDVTEEEELTLLATIDPMSTMAGTDWSKLSEIQSRVAGAISESVATLVEDVKEQGMGAVDLPPQETSAFYYPPDARQEHVERRNETSTIPPSTSAVHMASLYFGPEDFREYTRLIEIAKREFETTASASAVLFALKFVEQEASSRT